MPASMRFDTDAARDVVKGEVTYKGKLGAAQLRAVVPMAPLRAALKRRGMNMSGANVEGTCRVMGRSAVLGVIRDAANHAPDAVAQKTAAARAKRKRRVLTLVALGLGAGFAAAGGWAGLQKILAVRRMAAAAKLRAGGMAEEEVLRRVARQEQRDAADLDRAATIVEKRTEKDEDEEETEEADESGFSFKRVFGDVADTALSMNPATALQYRLAKAALKKRRKGGGKRRGPEPTPDDAVDTTEAPDDAESAPDDAAGLNPFARLALSAAVPGGPATLAVAERVNKSNPGLARSAVRLAKARGGDPKAINQVKAVRILAAKGHPGAKKELRQLHAANTLAKRVEGGGGRKKSLFEHGIV